MGAQVELSLHCRLKMAMLRSHGIEVSQEIIEDALRYPDKVDQGYRERLIAQKALDETPVLGVVYELVQDKTYVMTVSPGRRSRYEKDQG